MKKNIAVIFGGQSTEHEVSCKSAYNVISQIDRSLWNIVLIGITKEGRWVNTEKLESLKDGSWAESQVSAGDVLARVIDPYEGNVREEIVAGCDGVWI